jgi:hypothetical protein
MVAPALGLVWRVVDDHSSAVSKRSRSAARCVLWLLESELLGWIPSGGRWGYDVWRFSSDCEVAMLVSCAAIWHGPDDLSKQPTVRGFNRELSRNGGSSMDG